jgi:hypothetical protein
MFTGPPRIVELTVLTELAALPGLAVFNSDLNFDGVMLHLQLEILVK